MQKAKILIVEDERIVGEDIRQSLLNIGYTVTGLVSSGKDAINHIQKNKPDLILMDIVIKGEMNGIETTELIRSQFDIPVIYLTAYADDQTLERAKISEPFGYLLKPYEERELQSTIETALYKHQMEKKLKESEAWFSTTLLSIGDGVIVTDVEGCITFINTAAENITGWKQEEVLGKQRNEVFKIENEVTGEEIEMPFQRVIDTGLPTGIGTHAQIITRNGNKIPIDDSIAPIKGERGDLMGVVIVFHDIIERKLAEEALKESEVRYRSIFEDTRDAIYIVTRKGNFVIANQSTLNLFGYSDSEISKINIKDLFVHEEDWNQFQKDVEMKGVVRDYEVRLRNKKGKMLDCLLTSSIRKPDQNEITGYQCIIRDITEKKHADEALKKSEERYRLLTENITSIIWTMNAKMYFTFMTPSVEHVLGYSIHEILKMKLKDIIKSDSYENFNIKLFGNKTQSEIAIEMLTDSKSMEVVMACKNGTDIWMEVSLTFLPGQNDILGVAHNITERKKAEDEKDKIHAQLLQAQKMEAVGILAGGIAHDFNNLLTVIQGNADLSMMKIDDNDLVYKDIKEIQIATERAADLTSQLLLFSRKQPMQFFPVDFKKTVENLFKILHRLIGEDIGIRTDLASDTWIVRGDKGTLEQVIMNLVVNARDAMSEGGELTIKLENVNLSVDQCENMHEAVPGRFVCFTVQDEGVGFDEKTKERIFEPFFSTKGTGKGTGLGLSVVYGIVKQHNGWVDVVSQPGVGTTFSIYIPAVFEKTSDDGSDTVSLKKLRGDGERILIIEDEKGVREFTKVALKENNYEVFSVASAEEALILFQEEKGHFDMVLSDVVLQNKTGVEVVTEFLEQKPDLHVLMSSGYTGEKSQWSVIQEKGLRFLQKPYTMMQLLQSVKETLCE